ncbi:hypothetical protein [Sandarakinorhabdus sp.]|uniref:hypothetical protein n=1 Tax=Sandarakinorhabdus sp. TaxID=1916663 RepID=UPI003564AD9D
MSSNREYEAFLRALRALTDAPGGKEFNRQNVATLLDVLAQHLGIALASPVGTLEDGTQVVAEHPAEALLVSLISALRDLDSGLTDEVFKPTSHGANATRPWDVRELGCVDKGDSQKGPVLIQRGFWGGHFDARFDERRGMVLS